MKSLHNWLNILTSCFPNLEGIETKEKFLRPVALQVVIRKSLKKLTGVLCKKEKKEKKKKMDGNLQWHFHEVPLNPLFPDLI